MFFDKPGHRSPPVYAHFIRKFEAQHELTVFFHLRHVSVPHIADEERYSVSRIAGALPGMFRVVARRGYADRVVDEDLGRLLLELVRGHLDGETSALGGVGNGRASGDGDEITSTGTTAAAATNATLSQQQRRIRSELSVLSAAAHQQIVYVFGKEQLHLPRESAARRLRRLALGLFIWMRENTRSKPAEFNVPVDRLVEVGFVNHI